MSYSTEKLSKLRSFDRQ